MRFAGVQANDMFCQQGEHVEVADGSQFPFELGANGFAIIVASGDVPGDPSPLPMREGSV
jgi:hypothetical protein